MEEKIDKMGTKIWRKYQITPPQKMGLVKNMSSNGVTTGLNYHGPMGQPL